ncbi:hypothetical protein CLF_113035 [Clonorchis sinensis]|uniref:Uncharacterized protein n=1 Tax=Clonorchis sinensis TaxID=79923 RepID=G7YXH9_CLOSI|nr:hypothetical protein CLF_113035 [Clonorchis sinensis]
MRRTLEGLQNPGVQIASEENLVDLDDIFLIFEEEEKAQVASFPEVNYMRTLVLYRDMPYRCQCGNWFKLVDMERFEQAREEKWQKIKDEPENAQLLKELAETEEELNQLFQKGRGMTMYTRGATEVTEKLSVAWKRYRKIFLAIRKKMDIP